MFRYFVCAMLMLIVTGRPAHANAVIATLRDLVKSDQIVYAKVERIHVVGCQWRLDKKGHKIRIPTNAVAEARVVRVFQGKGIITGQTILIAAYKTWRCDDTQISLGEESMFFLAKRDVKRDETDDTKYPGWKKDITKFVGKEPLYTVAYAGQGKLPISIHQGNMSLSAYQSNYSPACFRDSYFTIQSTLPVSWDTQIKKKRGGTIYREGRIPVEAMEQFLRQLMAEQGLSRRLPSKKRSPNLADSKRPIVLRA
ncbi:MAG: hypothetical protein QM758_03650 [Armatimonas sp.]